MSFGRGFAEIARKPRQIYEIYWKPPMNQRENRKNKKKRKRNFVTCARCSASAISGAFQGDDGAFADECAIC